jgi:hypothetical protein
MARMTRERSWALFVAHTKWVEDTIEADGEPELVRDYPKPKANNTSDGQYNLYALDADANTEQEAAFDKLIADLPE